MQREERASDGSFFYVKVLGSAHTMIDQDLVGTALASVTSQKAGDSPPHRITGGYIFATGFGFQGIF